MEDDFGRAQEKPVAAMRSTRAQTEEEMEFS